HPRALERSLEAALADKAGNLGRDETADELRTFTLENVVASGSREEDHCANCREGRLPFVRQEHSGDEERCCDRNRDEANHLGGVRARTNEQHDRHEREAAREIDGKRAIPDRRPTEELSRGLALKREVEEIALFGEKEPDGAVEDRDGLGRTKQAFACVARTSRGRLGSANP